MPGSHPVALYLPPVRGVFFARRPGTRTRPCAQVLDSGAVDAAQRHCVGCAPIRWKRPVVVRVIGLKREAGAIPALPPQL